MSKQTKSPYDNLSSEVLIKKINAMFKQIDTCELFLKNNNSTFEFEKRDILTPDMCRIDLENTCNFVTNYHNKLKTEQTRINKLLEEQKKVEDALKEASKDKNKIVNINNDEEENYEDNKKEYPVITNLEELKRSFFSPDNEEYRPFETIINENPFKFYKVIYKYSNDMYKKPDYMASNLNNGFVQKFEDYKKYLFVCFRCFQNEDNYDYFSYWLFNSTESLKNVFGNDIEDFDFTETNVKNFIENFNKIDKNCNNLVNEKYLH